MLLSLAAPKQAVIYIYIYIYILIYTYREISLHFTETCSPWGPTVKNGMPQVSRQHLVVRQQLETQFDELAETNAILKENSDKQAAQIDALQRSGREGTYFPGTGQAIMA